MAFLGMRGTGDWATEERPKSWREGYLFLFPNGTAPLTAMTAKLASEVVSDPEYAWWTKTLPAQGGAVTAAYTDAILATAYTSGGVAGQTLFFKMAELIASEFRAGHQVLLRDADHLDVDVNAKVTAVVKNGANSYIAARLLEADDNGATTDLSDCDTALINGSINPEGGPMPDPIGYDPDKIFNYTQIFRNSLSITRTAKNTTLRTVDAYKEQKRESLQMHYMEIEKAFFWGIRTENIGANGKPERTTMGLIPCIKQYAPANVNNFALNTTYSGDTWLTSGEEWLDAMLEQVFRYGSTEKMAYVGSGVLLGINRIIKATGSFMFTPATVSYGIKVMQWVTPFGTINMQTHPLFSYEATTRNSMVVFEPSALRYRYVANSDTTFFPDDGKHGATRIDGQNEEWLTECGLEFHHPLKFAYLSGFNTDNAV